MSGLDARIILGGRGPDIMAAMRDGNALARDHFDMQRQGQLAQLYRDQGAGIAAGEDAAVNALAGLDPMAALGVRRDHKNMDIAQRNEGRADQQLQMQQQQMARQTEVQDRDWQMRVQQHAAQMSQQERQAQAQQIEQAVRMGLAAPDAASWDAMMAQQAPDLVGQFDQRQAHAQRFMSMADIMRGGTDARVQSSDVLDDGTSVMVLSNGSTRVVSPTGEVLEGQAAADAVRTARSYTVDNQREIYQGRREGTLSGDINLGGQATAVGEVAKGTVASGMSAWEDYSKLQANIGNLDEAIAAIDRGAQAGMVYNMLPNITEASASLGNAMDRMGLDVIGSVTFGALSEGELRLAMDVAVPRNLAPAELRQWLTKKREAQAKASEMLADAAQYLTTPGNTINGWIAKNRAGGAAGAGTGNPQPQPPAGGRDFKGMSAAELVQIDPSSLSIEELDAFLEATR